MSVPLFVWACGKNVLHAVYRSVIVTLNAWKCDVIVIYTSVRRKTKTKTMLL